ncbi:MAG: hypothetical protein JW889_07485 [Verrucomicrobia bacterium]|nr:hypothetical protein [Verrucomicrobiota bacterium]
MTMLDGLRWKPRWVSHLGCLAGCLEYLGVEVSEAWLYGATGHAFVMNIHEALCPSGPTAWKSDVLHELGEAAGYCVETFQTHKDRPDFAEVQEQAWEAARRALHDRIPVYGWELAMPEYYVVNGYDTGGYYFNGPSGHDGAGPKPWRELGVSEIGWLALHVVRRGEAKGDAPLVKQALEFAVAVRDDPRKYADGPYTMGLEAYDWWTKALEEGRAGGLGTAYNAAVWHECRAFAAQFLVEARVRLDVGGVKVPAKVFDAAIEAYGVVADNLRAVTELFPLLVGDEEKEEHVNDPDRCAGGLLHLRSAKMAEQVGLSALRQIAGAL